MALDTGMATPFYLPIDGQVRKRYKIIIYNLFYKIFLYLFYIFIDIRWYSCICSVEKCKMLFPKGMKSNQAKTSHDRTRGEAKPVMVHCPNSPGANHKASLTPGT